LYAELKPLGKIIVEAGIEREEIKFLVKLLGLTIVEDNILWLLFG
jgi:hypothetical protein